MFNIFKSYIIKFLYFLIEIVEKIEYRNISLCENDISKKIINSIDIKGRKIKTDTGYSSISQIHTTQPYTSYSLTLEDEYILNCADNHIVFNENMSEIFIKNLCKGDYIQTESGIKKVTHIKKKKYKISMFDATIDDKNHRYFTNGILSHNTVTSAIKMLHFITFNNDKNIMVVANKGETTIEIVDKIKNIYTNLPFFLKVGIKNWAQKTIIFDNGCRIKTATRTKTPAIGFTIDFLYLDEFAHIPSTIIEPYYRAVYPVVSAIENSKIIITSTPDGYNLFHNILVDAERPDGDPLKTDYRAKRVYWHQVPGRFVTYYKLNDFRLKENNITKEEIFEQVKLEYSYITKVELKKNYDSDKDIIYVYNSENCSEAYTKAFEFTTKDGNKINIKSLAQVSTWKEDTIKNIGGENNFGQEYDLRFINTSRSLISEAIIEKLLSNKKNYVFRTLDEFSNKLKFAYTDLKWVDDYDIFNPSNKKNMKIFISVDISEGLDQDYSIINIFKISPKNDTLIESQKLSYKYLSDYFCLEQIGMFRSNVCSVKQLAELFYVLCFEYFDSDNVKVVLEINTYGGEFLAHLPNIFDGNNNYGNYIFYRYKHRADATEEKIGIRVGENKNLLVKEYKERMENGDFIINNEDNIREITTFVKHETASGNAVYKADSGNDDCAMTVVEMASIFEKHQFREIVNECAPKLLNREQYMQYTEFLNKVSEYTQGADYSSLINVNRQRKIMREFLKTKNKF